jgi:hypothetical protein
MCSQDGHHGTIQEQGRMGMHRPASQVALMTLRLDKHRCNPGDLTLTIVSHLGRIYDTGPHPQTNFFRPMRDWGLVNHILKNVCPSGSHGSPS